MLDANVCHAYIYNIYIYIYISIYLYICQVYIEIAMNEQIEW